MLKQWLQQNNPAWTNAELNEAETLLLRYFESLYLTKKDKNDERKN